MTAFADFLLQALVNAARVDGEAADGEIDAIVTAMSAARGAPVSAEEVRAAIAGATLTREDLVAYLTKHGRRFTKEERTKLLRDLLSVIAADGRFETAERDALMAYIEAVGFAGAQANDVFDTIMQPFRNAV
ncbi:MAG: TerB family tellurite resistance protein [Hyphomonadaceae bacterium]